MAAKVLHFITELSIGGAQVALRRLLANLDRERFDPVVACLYNGDGAVARQIRDLAIPVHDLGMSGQTRLDAFWRFYRLLLRERPHILHTWMFHANVPGRIIGRMAGVPYIISAERTMGQEDRWRRRLNGATAPLADRVLCVSQEMAHFAAQAIGIAAAKLVVIPNGVDPADFADLPDRNRARAAYGLPATASIIGAIGRPRPVKGFNFLLDAFARLAADFPEAHLLFAGDGPDRTKLDVQAARFNLSERVTFLGDQADIPGLLPALDVLAVPSLHEGMPNVALEAMAAGLPVVASAVGGIPEVVTHGVTGLLVAPSDPVALAEALGEVLGNSSMAGAMGQAGRERVRSQFSLAKTVACTEALYGQLLGEAAEMGSSLG